MTNEDQAEEGTAALFATSQARHRANITRCLAHARDIHHAGSARLRASHLRLPFLLRNASSARIMPRVSLAVRIIWRVRLRIISRRRVAFAISRETAYRIVASRAGGVSGDR